MVKTTAWEGGAHSPHMWALGSGGRSHATGATRNLRITSACSAAHTSSLLFVPHIPNPTSDVDTSRQLHALGQKPPQFRVPPKLCGNILGCLQPRLSCLHLNDNRSNT
eukprot:1195138-Prorocentrum_minimum.AAC.8